MIFLICHLKTFCDAISLPAALQNHLPCTSRAPFAPLGLLEPRLFINNLALISISRLELTAYRRAFLQLGAPLCALRSLPFHQPFIRQSSPPPHPLPPAPLRGNTRYIAILLSSDLPCAPLIPAAAGRTAAQHSTEVSAPSRLLFLSLTRTLMNRRGTLSQMYSSHTLGNESHFVIH